MKKTIVLLAVLNVISLRAQTQETFTVLERQEGSNKTFYRDVVLPDLESDTTFDGKYFKIVKGKSNDAIDFKQNEDLVLRAANVYWHLSKARKFWVQEMKSDFPFLIQKLTVRIDHTNVFDSQGHFAHDNKEPQFNNALSIPAGETPDWVPVANKDKWEKEIWFRPVKRIDVRELAHTLGDNPMTQVMSTLEQPILNYTQNRFSQSLMEQLFYPSYSNQPIHSSIIRFAGTVAITRAVIEASRLMDRLFVEKYYYLDSAMIPEIIYHEFAHIVLSDHLELSHSTPVIEGMADYFAAIQSKKKKIYGKVRGLNNANPKNPRNTQTYSHWHESNSKANADFVLSVLWDVRETLGAPADQLIYEVRTMLRTETATINSHLLKAILKACETKCEMPERDKLKLYEVFAMKGF